MSRFEVTDDCHCAADVMARNRYVMMFRKRSYGRQALPKPQPPAPEPEPNPEPEPPPKAAGPVVEIPKFQPLPPGTIRLIIAVTAEHFGIRTDELLSERKLQYLVRARWVAIYLAKKLTGRSLNQIGLRFDEFHHTSVLYALSRIKELLAADDLVTVTACREIEEKITSLVRTEK